MLIILASVVGAGKKGFLCDPLQKVVNLAVKCVEFEHLFQLPATLAGQVFQAGVQLVHL
jgi:hypothetical protein